MKLAKKKPAKRSAVKRRSAKNTNVVKREIHRADFSSPYWLARSIMKNIPSYRRGEYLADLYEELDNLHRAN